MQFKFFILLIITCCLYSCIKPPQYSDIPHIQFVSLTPSTIPQYGNDTITFSFTDGTGQLGVNTSYTDTDSLCALKDGDSAELHSPVHNIFIIDTRDDCIYPYASGNVSTSGKYKGISGNIEVFLTQITSLKCYQPGPGCNDTVVYAIVIKDAAGNLSNFIQTTPIVINDQ